MWCYFGLTYNWIFIDDELPFQLEIMVSIEDCRFSNMRVVKFFLTRPSWNVFTTGSILTEAHLHAILFGRPVLFQFFPYIIIHFWHIFVNWGTNMIYTWGAEYLKLEHRTGVNRVYALPRMHTTICKRHSRTSVSLYNKSGAADSFSQWCH